MNKAAIFFIKIYQYTLSPFLPDSCRHYPTCSEYSIEAFRQHNFFFAIYLTIKRILKCNPFFEGGYDPVPDRKNKCDHNLRISTKF